VCTTKTPYRNDFFLHSSSPRHCCTLLILGLKGKGLRLGFRVVVGIRLGLGLRSWRRCASRESAHTF